MIPVGTTRSESVKYHVSSTDGKIPVRIILNAYFSTFVPLTSCFLSSRPFVVNATFSTGLVVPSTRLVKNVALTTNGLQERKHLVSGTRMEK